MSFDPVDHAKQEIMPLLDDVVSMAATEKHPDQERFFRSIREGIGRCQDAEDLADPMMQLSMSAFVGFEYSGMMAILIDRVLAHAQLLTESLSLSEEEIN
ncbi:MAG: hypothetical protein AB8G23_20385 [Myxococcota bacterium]